MKPPFGLTATLPESRYCWGARAIYRCATRPCVIDILWDRQGWEGECTQEEREALASWLKRKLPLLCATLDGDRIGGESEDRVTIRNAGFRLTASPLRSYGYLYIVVEPDPEATRPVGLPQARKGHGRERGQDCQPNSRTH